MFLLFGESHAEAVNLNNGQGWIFQHRGNCYLIVPAHVAGTKRNLQFSTAAPVVHGDARVMRNFKTAHDLALFFVNPGLGNRCNTPWQDIPSDITNRLKVGAKVTLTEVRSSGLVDSLSGTIEAFDSYRIILAPNQDDSLYQGRSGSALLRDGVFIGMAIEAECSNRGIFLRADEIHDELRGLIARSTAFVRTPVVQPLTDGGCELPVGLITAVSCSASTLSDERPCSDLMSGKPIRFSPEALPLIIELSLESEPPIRLSSVLLMASDAESNTVTEPKSVLVLVDSSAGARRRWKRFGGRDAAPDGSVRIVNGAQPRARHIQLIVQSSWDPSLPIEVGCIVPQ